MNTRLLGVIMIVGSILAALNNFRSDGTFDQVSSIALIIWCISVICGLIAMLRLNALGQNPVARAAVFLPILGFATIIVSDTLRLAGIFPEGTPVNFALATIGWLGILAGMLVVAIITIAAKTWTGWRRFAPLLTIVFIPLALSLGSLIHNTELSGAVSYLAFVLLGIVIATAEPVHELHPAVNA